MATLYKWKLLCTNESMYKYVWATTPPTTCPDDTVGHTIDINSVHIIETLADNIMKIQEESVPTGGNFATTTIRLDAAANATTSASISWPMPISALAVEFISEETHRGDFINMSVGKNTPIGIVVVAITAATAHVVQNYIIGNEVYYLQHKYICTADTIANDLPTDVTYWDVVPQTITVNNMATVNTMLGYDISIAGEYLGRVVAISTMDSTITTEYATSIDLAVADYVLNTVAVMRDYEIHAPWEHIIGNDKIGGSYIPKNISITVDYTNMSGVDKVLVGVVGFLY